MVKHPFRTFKAYGRCVHSHDFAICAQNETHSARRNQGLTDNVNLMAMNLTNQVRSIAEVTKAVAGGDLTKRITVDVRGEMLDLKETVNGMTESLSLFADEVTCAEGGRNRGSVGWPGIGQQRRRYLEGLDGQRERYGCQRTSLFVQCVCWEGR